MALQPLRSNTIPNKRIKLCARRMFLAKSPSFHHPYMCVVIFATVQQITFSNRIVLDGGEQSALKGVL